MTTPAQTENPLPEFVPKYPYTEMTALPIPNEPCPTLIKVTKVTLLLFTMGALFAGGGFLIHLSTLSITIETGLGSGTAIGLLVGTLLSWKTPMKTLTIDYREKTLDNLSPLLGLNDRTARAFKNVKETFSKAVKFNQTYEIHNLHKDVTHITEAMRGSRLDVQRVWLAFLQHLNGSSAINADGRQITLDFSLQIARVEDQLIPQIQQLERQVKAQNMQLPKKMQLEPSDFSFPKVFEIEAIDSRTATYDEDLIQIREMQEVCFGEGAIFNEEMLKAKLAEHKDNKCFVIREQNGSSKKIYAFAWIQRTEEGISLSGIARDPGATRSNLGAHLIQRVKKEIPYGDLLHLKVRQSNPAIRLYEKEGFELIAKMDDYFINPKEGAYHLGYKKPAGFFKELGLF